MHQQVINVHNYIGEAVDDSFHESLEAGGAPQQTHGAGDPLELPHAWNGEGSVGACPGVQNHLPESGREVDGTKNSTARSTDFPDAFADVLHRIFVGVGLVVEGSEILYQPYPSILFHHRKYGAVVATSGGLNDAEF